MSKVIILNGPIGSGKTTVGSSLAQQLGGIFLDLDDFALAEIQNWDNLTPENEARVWRNACQKAAENINQLGLEQEHVVIAGPFLDITELFELKNQLHPSREMYFYSLETPTEVRYERTKKRENKEPSAVWYAEVERIKQGRQKPGGMVIVNEESVQDAVDKIAAAIRGSRVINN